MPSLWLHLILFAASLILAVVKRNGFLGFLGAAWLLWTTAAAIFALSGGGLGAVLTLVHIGPALTPLIIGWLTMQFPVLMTPILIGALSASFFILSRAGLLRFSSRSAFLSHLIFFMTAWICAEMVVFGVIRAQAMETADGDYCLTQRAAIGMLFAGLSDGYVSPHAALVDGRTTYTWSFRQRAFVMQTNPNFIRYDDESECLKDV